MFPVAASGLEGGGPKRDLPGLHKAYDALDRYRCLEILEGYGVGPRAWRLLMTFWGKMTMVARAEGYYGDAFMGARGVT